MSDIPPVGFLLELAGGYALPRCLHVAADLGIADLLDETPRTAAELAAGAGADAGAVGRIMHLLSAHGVFEAKGSTFVHTAASRLLRSDHPRSMRAVVRLFGLPIFWDGMGFLGDSAASGEVAAEKVHPGGFFAWFADNPEAGRIFSDTIESRTQDRIAGVLAAYDFSGFASIADIGGRRGQLLRAILDVAPAARGVLFDRPGLVAEAADIASDRLAVVLDDGEHDTPVCDAYVLMEVIQTWSDADAVRVLRAIRKAAPRGATVLIIELLLPDDPGPHFAKTLDIHMLALLGGRQRSGAEYRALLEAARLKFRREIATESGVSIIEAVTG